MTSKAIQNVVNPQKTLVAESALVNHIQKIPSVYGSIDRGNSCKQQWWLRSAVCAAIASGIEKLEGFKANKQNERIN